MRYKLTKQFKELIKSNERFISSKNKDLKWTLKNLIYKNKSIHQKQVELLSSILKFNTNLKPINFQKEKNLGKYSQPRKIKFSYINEQFAEFVGILIGDGNIYKNNVRIMLDKREKQYQNYIKILANSLFNFKFNGFEDKKSNRFVLYKNNKELVKLLIKSGLKSGNKIKNQVSIPDWIKKNKKFTAACLRGLLDTDGCVYKCKRDNKMYIKFTSASSILLNDVKNLAKGLGINFVSAGKSNICLYRQKEILKYLNLIGFSNMKHKTKVKQLK